MKIDKIPIDELKKDLSIVLELSIKVRDIENKYEPIIPGNTLYGIKKAILEELGLRSIEKDAQ